MTFFIPFDFQKEAIESIFNYFNSGKTGNPLVVAPTGSGKSVIIADFCRYVIENWPDQKILVLSDDAEVLTQDFNAICKQVHDRSIVGLYSSGLKSKDKKQITVAGIQSIYKKTDPEEDKVIFTDFDIILLDEAHTVSYDKKSRYRKFFSKVNVPIVGLTATPFRLGTGFLHLAEGALFDEIVYTITIKALQDAGKLCEITSKQPGTVLDASSIKKQAGDFIIKELSMAFDRELITTEIVSDMAQYKDLRKKWMVYAIDIDHCEHVSETLNNAGIKSIALHSKTEGGRGQILNKFRDGEYQAIVSVAMLTTGVDVPEVDLIVLLRPTASPVLHVQIIGRGMRVSPLKDDCLVLDYAGNLLRNGPIDSPTIVLKGKGNGEAMMKVCDGCNEIVPIATRTCKSCGAKFEFKHNLTAQSSDGNVIAQSNWHDVTNVAYQNRMSARGPEMLVVFYQCGTRSFKENICFDHGRFATHQAKYWWSRRSTLEGPPPHTSRQAFILSDSLMKPIKILVNESGKYDDIKEQIFK